MLGHLSSTVWSAIMAFGLAHGWSVFVVGRLSRLVGRRGGKKLRFDCIVQAESRNAARDALLFASTLTGDILVVRGGDPFSCGKLDFLVWY